VSVWGTIWSADDDEHTNRCSRWSPPIKTGPHAWSSTLDDSRPCDCGQPGAPIIYQPSHILPAPTDPRGGSISLAEIPGHITRDGRDDGPDDQWGTWPWLRLSVGQEDAVLDEALARSLRDALDGWLTAREAKP
jgi:hypothetical protein